MRARADLLRLARTTLAPLRPFAVELFRAQTHFNHRVVDVLEDAVWTFRRADHSVTIEQRLGPLTLVRAVIANARGGVRGQLILWTKRAGLSGLDAALRQTLGSMEQLNRTFVESLKSRTPLPSVSDWREGLIGKRWLGLQTWFLAQAEFYEAVSHFVRELGDALTDYSVAFTRFAARNEKHVKAGWPRSTVRAKVQVLSGTQKLDLQADVVFRLPPGETLAPDAIDIVSELFAARPEVQLCYGDTWVKNAGWAALKPGWSPEYLLSANYIGGCFAMRTERAAQLGLEATVPSMSWLLQGQFRDAQVVRVPWVLSTRSLPEPEDPERDAQIVAAHLGTSAEIEQRRTHRLVRFQPSEPCRVTIIVPFKDRVELLRGLWNSLQRWDPGVSFELLLVSNQSVEDETFEFLEQLRDPRVCWFCWDEPFNWSAINNAAAARAKGELLLFLNNDIEATHDGWLRDLAGYACRPEVGVAGARLLYADGSVQHAGVVIGLRGLAGHVFARWRPEYPLTPFGTPQPTRNWSAVTGACLMIRRALFEELRGFDQRIRVSGGDIDLCLRVRERGLRVVCVGHVELTHYESVSRGGTAVPVEDIRLEAEAYARLLAVGDPYYHPQLSAEVGHGGLGPSPLSPADHAAAVMRLYLP